MFKEENHLEFEDIKNWLGSLPRALWQHRIAPTIIPDHGHSINYPEEEPLL